MTLGFTSSEMQALEVNESVALCVSLLQTQEPTTTDIVVQLSTQENTAIGT